MCTNVMTMTFVVEDWGRIECKYHSETSRVFCLLLFCLVFCFVFCLFVCFGGVVKANKVHFIQQYV